MRKSKPFEQPLPLSPHEPPGLLMQFVQWNVHGRWQVGFFVMGALFASGLIAHLVGDYIGVMLDLPRNTDGGPVMWIKLGIFFTVWIPLGLIGERYQHLWWPRWWR
jgi:hypothetical protein